MKKIFLSFCKRNAAVYALVGSIAVVYSLFILFYGLPTAAVLYPLALCAAGTGIYTVCGFLSYRKKIGKYIAVRDSAGELSLSDEKADLIEKELIALNETLIQRLRTLENENAASLAAMTDYYTVWAHQIKTPIASMKLILQSEDSENARRLSSALMKIEQYVQMALIFIRLESTDTDYVFRRTQVDQVVLACVRRFSGDFIMKKLKADIKPTGIVCVTDEKWLSFILEQLLSNALKYTNTGGIYVCGQGQCLMIRDTGIGISSQDIPRIFEKGFTGCNGRNDKSATGLGLYLCKMVADRLGCKLSVQSVPGEGTCVTIDLSQKSGEAQ